MPPNSRDRNTIPGWRHAQNRQDGLRGLITDRVWTLDLSRTSPCLYTFAPQGQQAENMAANIGGICAHLERRIEYNETRMMLYNDPLTEGGEKFLRRFIKNHFLKNRSDGGTIGRLEIIMPEDQEKARAILDSLGLTQAECERKKSSILFKGGPEPSQSTQQPAAISENAAPPTDVREAKGANLDHDRRSPDEWMRAWQALDEQARGRAPTTGRRPIDHATRPVGGGDDFMPG